MVEVGAFLRFDGIILKNNLNATLKKEERAPDDKSRLGHGCRILCQNGSTLEFFRCGFDMVGGVTYDGVKDLNMKTSLSYTSRGDSFPVWKLGFIQSEGAKIKVFSAIDVEYNLGCYFIGHAGWAPGLSVDTSVSLKDSTAKTVNITNSTRVSYLAYRIYGTQIDQQGEVQILLAPQSDVSATNFDSDQARRA